MRATPSRLLGATVARLAPDQKVACSNHVGVKYFKYLNNLTKTIYRRNFTVTKNIVAAKRLF